MRLVEVESSMIHAVGYDEETQTLEVIFNSGKVYYYSDVPKEVYEDLLAAESKGRYMLSRIIDVYPYTRRKRGRRQASVEGRYRCSDNDSDTCP